MHTPVPPPGVPFLPAPPAETASKIPGPDGQPRGPSGAWPRRVWHELRVGWAHTRMTVWNSRNARVYYAKALYCRGYAHPRVAGLRARFLVRDSADFNHLTGRYFESEQLGAFLRLLQPTDIVYDIGAHVGTWTVFLAKRVPRGRVCALEPAPQTYDRLVANLRLNGLTNALPLQAAAASENGSMDLGVTAEAGTGQSSLLVGAQHARVVPVRTVRLDDAPAAWDLPQPTAVKIDCEGGEWGVLAGMPRLLNAPSLRLIAIEAHPQQLARIGHGPQDLFATLERAGFTVTAHWDRQTEIMRIYTRAPAIG